METEVSILALAALAQSTRLEAFRLLVRHEPDGLPAGDISNHLVIPANTLSSHLGVLTRAGLIRSERRSRLTPVVPRVITPNGRSRPDCARRLWA